MKPILYITPRYIAPLKYFEKLLPDLTQRFDVSFLLLEDNGMCTYLRSKNLPFVEDLLPRKRALIPFVSHILAYAKLLKNARRLFRKTHPSIILTETTISEPMRAVFAIAKREGATIKALQWCQQSSAYKHIRLSFRNRIRQLRARHGGILRGTLREAYFFLLRMLFWLLGFLRVLPTNVADRHVERLGVIDRFGADYFEEQGWDRNTMSVVGFFDWSSLRVLRERLLSDATFRRSLLGRHGLMPQKRHVLILSTVFYAGHATLTMSKEEQVRYFSNITEDVRAAYPDAEILFKLHPRDEDLYADLKTNGVRLFGNEADVEELIALADLYIAHPLTAANFSVIGSGVPALFINFTSLSFLNTGKELYGLSTIITDRKTFRQSLARAALGDLPLSYDETRADQESREKIIAFVSE